MQADLCGAAAARCAGALVATSCSRTARRRQRPALGREPGQRQRQRVRRGDRRRGSPRSRSALRRARVARRAGRPRLGRSTRAAPASASSTPSTLAVVQTITLPRASQPFGLVFAPDGSAAYVALEAQRPAAQARPGQRRGAGQRRRRARTRATCPCTAASDRVLVSRFITPPLPGEGTASVQTEVGGAPRGGEVVVVNAATLAVERTIVLQHSDKPDATIAGPRHAQLPGRARRSRPTARSAWVPSKQDNIKRGTLRDGQQPQLPEHGARDQLAHRPGAAGRGSRARASTTTTPAWPAPPSSTRPAPTCSSRCETSRAGGGGRPRQPQRDLPLRRRPRAAGPGGLGRRPAPVRQQLHGPHASACSTCRRWSNYGESSVAGAGHAGRAWPPRS